MIKRKDELTKVVGPIEGGKGEISRELLIEGDELKNKAKELTPKIGLLRKWLGYCEEIEEQSLHINKFLEEKVNVKSRKGKAYERN